MSPRDIKSPEEESEQKKAYQEKIEAQLKEWGAKIDELKARVEKSKVELKKKYEKQIEDLRVKQQILQQKLRQLKESGAQTWEGPKTGMEKGLRELKGSLDSTLSTFKEKGEETAEKMLRKKEVYVQKMEARLKKWDLKIDILKAKAQKSKAETKITYLKQIEELRIKQDSMKQKLHDLKGSGDEAWRELKYGVDKALEDLKGALDQAVSKFKRKE